MAAKMSVKVKQSPRIKPPNGRVFDDRKAYSIGMAMLLSNKKRIQQSLGDKDERLPPLSKGYAIWKQRKGKGNLRNSILTGETMGNFTLRKATSSSIVAGLTARKPRERMQKQQTSVEKKGHSVWGFSSKDIKTTFDTAEKEFQGAMRRMVVIKRD